MITLNAGNHVFDLSIMILILLLSSGCAGRLPLLSNAGYPIGNPTTSISSWKELNQQNIIMQRFDYSCGAASLATLIKYYFHEDISEKQLLDHIENYFSKKEYKRIEELGLSFLELEKISQSLGYQSANVRLEIPALLQLSGPVIVFLQTTQYRHFAVLRGIKEDRVFLADPSRGNIIQPIQDFLREWKGETFILGKNGFGTPNKHSLVILHGKYFRNELKLLRQPLLSHQKAGRARLQ